MSNSSADSDKIELYKQVHLRSKKELSDDEKIPFLEKKRRSKWIQLVLNVSIILLFAYMYTQGLTTFDDWFYYLLFGIFSLNLFLIYFQVKHINVLIDHINTERDRGFSV
ncbi:MAG: hypothetical protein EA391_07655 [Balneolaceae bacterium]|nr:MAG: hypothetical protein EA391_07655 [Balneolaceae bacterium]